MGVIPSPTQRCCAAVVAHATQLVRAQLPRIGSEHSVPQEVQSAHLLAGLTATGGRRYYEDSHGCITTNE